MVYSGALTITYKQGGKKSSSIPEVLFSTDLTGETIGEVHDGMIRFLFMNQEAIVEKTNKRRSVGRALLMDEAFIGFVFPEFPGLESESNLVLPPFNPVMFAAEAVISRAAHMVALHVMENDKKQTAWTTIEGTNIPAISAVYTFEPKIIEDLNHIPYSGVFFDKVMSALNEVFSGSEEPDVQVARSILRNEIQPNMLISMIAKDGLTENQRLLALLYADTMPFKVFDVFIENLRSSVEFSAVYHRATWEPEAVKQRNYSVMKLLKSPHAFFSYYAEIINDTQKDVAAEAAKWFFQHPSCSDVFLLPYLWASNGSYSGKDERSHSLVENQEAAYGAYQRLHPKFAGYPLEWAAVHFSEENR